MYVRRYRRAPGFFSAGRMLFSPVRSAQEIPSISFWIATSRRCAGPRQSSKRRPNPLPVLDRGAPGFSWTRRPLNSGCGPSTFRHFPPLGLRCKLGCPDRSTTVRQTSSTVKSVGSFMSSRISSGWNHDSIAWVFRHVPFLRDFISLWWSGRRPAENSQFMTVVPRMSGQDASRHGPSVTDFGVWFGPLRWESLEFSGTHRPSRW